MQAVNLVTAPRTAGEPADGVGTAMRRVSVRHLFAGPRTHRGTPTEPAGQGNGRQDPAAAHESQAGQLQGAAVSVWAVFIHNVCFLVYRRRGTACYKVPDETTARCTQNQCASSASDCWSAARTVCRQQRSPRSSRLASTLWTTSEF